MPIPLSTTTISVWRISEVSSYDEPYAGEQETSGRQQITSGVRAVIGRPSGREQVAGGEQSVSDFQLVADLDERTGIDYRVVWAITYPDEFGPGFFTEASIRHVEGDI
jgi:hypothetical protein